MAQRLVRAKRKIRDAGIPLRVPPEHRPAGAPARGARDVYLVFNAGYGAARPARALRRGDPPRAPARHADAGRGRGTWPPRAAAAPGRPPRCARRPTAASCCSTTRTARLWDSDEIAQGTRALERALLLRPPGPYQLQAAIAALHAERDDRLAADRAPLRAARRAGPSPVVELNRAVAVAMADGPEPGSRSWTDCAARRYHLLHSARADLLRRLGRRDEAAAAYSARSRSPERVRARVPRTKASPPLSASTPPRGTCLRRSFSSERAWLVGLNGSYTRCPVLDRDRRHRHSVDVRHDPVALVQRPLAQLREALELGAAGTEPQARIRGPNWVQPAGGREASRALSVVRWRCAEEMLPPPGSSPKI